MVHNVPHSKKTKVRLSRIRKELWETEGYRQKIKEARENSRKWKKWMKIFPTLSAKYYLEHPEAIEVFRRRMVNYFKNPEARRHRSELTKEQWKDPKFLECVLEGRKKLRGKNAPSKRPEVRKKIAKKLMGNKNWVNARRSLKPNILEEYAWSVIERACPKEYDYNFGDCIIANGEKRKIPDFVHRNKDIVIEIFGDYWHQESEEAELTEFYKAVGYRCLVLWEHEFKDVVNSVIENNELSKLGDLILRIKSFTGATV